MNALFNRWLPAATLAAWGGVILYYWSSGRLEAVLKGEFQVYAIIAAVLLLIGAIVVAFSNADASCCADSACSHALGRSKAGRLLTFGIILLPLALKPFGSAAALKAVQGKNRIATDDFGSVAASVKSEYKKNLASRGPAAPATPITPAGAAADNLIVPAPVTPPPPLPLPAKEGTQPPAATASGAPSAGAGSQPPASTGATHPAAAQQESFADYLQRTPEGYIVAEVLDLLYAAQDNVLRKDFEDKTVQLVVQYMPDTGATAGSARFKGVRMFMTCCAADARPIATLIEGEKLPTVPEMTWVKVTGKATFPVERGRRISVVKAEKVEKTEPPPESMLN
jgi:uncharacterized membrane protein YcgQ (UPF0703/DUF1980 family)